MHEIPNVHKNHIHFTITYLKYLQQMMQKYNMIHKNNKK